MIFDWSNKFLSGHYNTQVLPIYSLTATCFDMYFVGIVSTCWFEISIILQVQGCRGKKNDINGNTLTILCEEKHRV